MPLVIALHGNGSTGPQTEKLTHFDEVAAREQFVVVYPDAIDHHWNDGRPEFSSAVDDVAFISALIDELASQHGIDRKRVYVTGISNGAIMSYRLGCDLADRIVAIAPVAGGYPAKVACKPGPAVSVLAINGTADPLVPYEGGEVHHNRGLISGAVASTELFAQRAGCGPIGAAEVEPDRAPDDGTRVRHQIYPGCRSPFGVELVSVDGGGHTWPGGPQYAPKLLIGPASRDFDATERIWTFFVSHTPM